MPHLFKPAKSKAWHLCKNCPAWLDGRGTTVEKYVKFENMHEVKLCQYCIELDRRKTCTI